MKILLIEDDVNKRNSISQLLVKHWPEISIVNKSSRQSGLRACVTDDFDLLLLDMSLPLYEVSSSESGYEFRHFAGLEIMEELTRYGKSVPTVVITQFEVFGEAESRMSFRELVVELEKRFIDTFKGAVFYSAASTAWEKELIELLRHSI